MIDIEGLSQDSSVILMVTEYSGETDISGLYVYLTRWASERNGSRGQPRPGGHSKVEEISLSQRGI